MSSFLSTALPPLKAPTHLHIAQEVVASRIREHKNINSHNQELTWHSSIIGIIMTAVRMRMRVAVVMIIIMIVIEYFVYIRQYSGSFTYMNSSNLHDDPTGTIIIPLLWMRNLKHREFQ